MRERFGQPMAISAQRHQSPNVTDDRLDERLEGSPLAIAASDEHHVPGTVAESFQRRTAGAHIGCFGVIDVGHAVDFGHQSGPMRQAAESSQHLGLGADINARSVGDGSGGKHVEAIVPASERQFASLQTKAVDHDILPGEAPVAVLIQGDGRYAGRWLGAPVVGVENRLRRASVNALLAACVGIDVWVAIQVIGTYVEKSGHRQIRAGQPFQLKTRKFQHIAVAAITQQIQRRRTEIAANAHVETSTAHQFANQGDHRALAVGAGDAHHRRPGVGRGRKKQFDVAADWHLGIARSGD